VIKLAIIGADGKHLSPQDLTTATELVEAVEKARTLIRECERLAQQKKSPQGAPAGSNVPYSS